MKSLLSIALLGLVSFSAVAAPAPKKVAIEGTADIKETRIVRQAAQPKSDSAQSPRSANQPTSDSAQSPRYAKLVKKSTVDNGFNNPFLHLDGGKPFLAASSKTDNGEVRNYIDLASLDKTSVNINGKPRNVISVFSTTLFSDGVNFKDDIYAYSSTEQLYVTCKPKALYQNRLAAFDENGEGIFGRSYDKKDFKLSDFRKPTPKSISAATVDAICTASNLINKKG